MNPPANRITPAFLALGDSYTIGEGVSPRDRWPSQVVAAVRETGIDLAEPQIIARTGWTTDELNAAIDAADPKGTFEVVTLMIGVNDQYRGHDARNYRSSFARLLRRAIRFAAGEPGRVLVVSIPDWGVTPFAEGRDRARIAAEIDAFNAINRDETQKAGGRYADITPASRQGASMVTADGLHPSAEMYTQWTATILPLVLAIAAGGGVGKVLS